MHHIVPNLRVEVFIPQMAELERWDLTILGTLFYQSCPGNSLHEVLEE
jgi:hypothetical protein